MILLTLHGSDGDEHDFDHVARILAPRAEILCPRVDDRFVEQLIALPRDSRPMYALGYASGADLAARLLLTRPGLLTGAVLLRPTQIEAPDPLPELNGVPVLAVPGRQGSHSVPKLLAKAGAAVDLAIQDADEFLVPQDFALAKRWLAQFG